MDFIESKLLKLTNWIWAKRHKPIDPTISLQKKNAVKNTAAMTTKTTRTPRKKKDEWNAHL